MVTLVKGQKVVRVTGDYVVGRIGEIIKVLDNNIIYIKWQFGPKTKVNSNCIQNFSPFTVKIVKGKSKNKKIVIFD